MKELIERFYNSIRLGDEPVPISYAKLFRQRELWMKSLPKFIQVGRQMTDGGKLIRIID